MVVTGTPLIVVGLVCAALSYARLSARINSGNVEVSKDRTVSSLLLVFGVLTALGTVFVLSGLMS